MWKLSIEDDQANKTVVTLVRDEYALGRAESNTVRLTERNVSRHHARLRRGEDKGWLLDDLDSYNGCFVNGRRVVGTQKLEHGDLAQIGDYRLTVLDDSLRDRDVDLSATVPAGPRGESLLDQPDRLVMLVGPTPGVEFPLVARPLVIGRGDECDITLNHTSVSRCHAEVRPLEDGRYEIIDRKSANGVRVNGVELPRSLLDARDTLELGDVVLKFIPAGQIYRPSPEESQQLSALASATPQGVDGAGAARGLRLLLFGVFIGLAVATVAAFALRRTNLLGPGPSTAGLSNDRTADTLAQAKALLEAGDVLGAHAKAQAIPETSNARQSETFKHIQSAWADNVLQAARLETNVAHKRRLLNSVATTSSVDGARRARAADAIAELDSRTLDVTDLPSRRLVSTPSPPPDAGKEEEDAGILVEAPPTPRKAVGRSVAVPTPAGATQEKRGSLLLKRPRTPRPEAGVD